MNEEPYMLWIPDVPETDPSVDGAEDPLLRELLEAMTRPIEMTCRNCGCVDNDHSKILIGRPCLNFACIHECFEFDGHHHASSIIPILLRA